MTAPPEVTGQADVLGVIEKLAPYILPILGMGVFEYVQNRRKAKREQTLEDREYDRDFIQRLLDDRAKTIASLEKRNEELEQECDLCKNDREQLKVQLAKVESRLQSASATLLELHRRFGDQISTSWFHADPPKPPPPRPPKP